MIKIAHIQLLPLLSGAQRVSLEELKRLPSNKYKKYLISSSEGPLTQEAKKYDIECIIVPTLKREISPKNDLLSLFALIKIIKKERFDIVHTHSSKPGILGRIAAFLLRTPLIVHTVHGFSFPAAKNKKEYFLYLTMERIGTFCGDSLICLHNNDKNIAIKKLYIKEKNILVIPNGVDTNLYTPLDKKYKNEIRKNLQINNNDISIGMIGRLWEQKNPLLLLNAAIELLHKHSNLKFYFVGDGEYFNLMDDIIKRNELTNKIFLLGWRNDTEIILNALDIFVLPSKWEGMPLAILEAQSTAVPCVVSDIQGNKEIIVNNKTGILFESNSKSELIKSIDLLVSNPEKRKEIAQNARNYITENHFINDRINKLDHYYTIKLKNQIR
ncbi:glycosyltransferase family 4 protein [Proteus penneri]|uniref:glycosyltransferase family 4 protein n=1 Tax=Proteus penneri TaxID=102862 RepID=UPI001EFA72CC|nr:glycosyltransferase family 4 protein [Proteus penneri]